MKNIFLLIITSIILFNTNSFSQTQNDKIIQSNISIQKNEIKSETLSQKINSFFTPVVKKMGKILFWDTFESADFYDPTVYDNNNKSVIEKNGEIEFLDKEYFKWYAYDYYENKDCS